LDRYPWPPAIKENAANLMENGKIMGEEWFARAHDEDGVLRCTKLHPNMKTFEQWVVENKLLIRTWFK